MHRREVEDRARAQMEKQTLEKDLKVTHAYIQHRFETRTTDMSTRTYRTHTHTHTHIHTHTYTTDT